MARDGKLRALDLESHVVTNWNEGFGKNGTNATGATNGGNASPALFFGGAGGSAEDGHGGNGGLLEWLSGQGGSTTGSGSAGSGGPGFYFGGAGGNASGTGNGGPGGLALFGGGTGGNAVDDAATAGSGGDAQFAGGGGGVNHAGTGTGGNGGNAILQGGTGAGGGAGGGTGGNGGHAFVDGGAGGTGTNQGTKGIAKIGTQPSTLRVECGRASGAPVRDLSSQEHPTTAETPPGPDPEEYGLDSSHDTVLVDATSGGLNANLPAASTCPGRQYTVRKTAGSGTVQFVATGGDTVDGAATRVIGAGTGGIGNAHELAVTVQAYPDGGGWFSVRNLIIFDPPS
jgi:hypothetical protein